MPTPTPGEFMLWVLAALVAVIAAALAYAVIANQVHESRKRKIELRVLQDGPLGGVVNVFNSSPQLRVQRQMTPDELEAEGFPRDLHTRKGAK